MPPLRRPQLGQLARQARVVLMNILLAGAHACAAADLVAKARPMAGCVEAQRLQAKPLLVGDRPQSAVRRALRAKQAVEEGQRVGIDLARLGQAQALEVEDEAAQLAGLAQLAVVRGRKLLHQPRLGQQRAELAGSAPPIDAPDFARQLHLLLGADVVREVREDPRAHGHALADIEWRPACPVEEVDAGRLRNGVDRRALEMRRQGRLASDLARRHRHDLLAVRALGETQELPQRLGVGAGAVPGRAGEPVALDQAVQVVARMPGLEPPRELHGAQRLRQVLQAGALELAPQEAVIEARVVRDEQATVEPLVELGGERGETRRGGDHLVADAGERLDSGLDAGFGVDQRRPLGGGLEAVHLQYRDLGDAIAGRMRAGGLEVDDRERRVPQHGYPSRYYTCRTNEGAFG